MTSSTSHRVYSDLFGLYDFVQQVAVAQGKNLLIDTLREYFRQDTIYTYRTNAYGFPLTPNVTDLPPDIQEERTTRIHIGDIFRMDKRYWPSITVRHSSARYKPISFNQNDQTTKYRVDLVMDGYGNESYVRVPTHKIMAGAWEQSFDVKISTESIPDREELADIVASFLINVAREKLYRGGLFIKGVSYGAESEEKYGNENIYMQSITVETYSEWRRQIPVTSLTEVINFCFEYGLFDVDYGFSGVSVTDQLILS
jgi:hypothetical protein